MGIFGTGDAKQAARREEAKTRRKEAAAEKKQIQNKKMQQKLKDREARNKAYSHHMGHGIVFFNKKSKTKRSGKKPFWKGGGRRKGRGKKR